MVASCTDTRSGTAAVNLPTPPAATPDAPARPADIIANLLKQNPAPTPYVPTWNPSTNPAVFMLDDYNKQGNLSLIMREINHENGLRSTLYQNGLQNWVIGGMQGPPPAPPHYETMDLNGFNQWWDNLNAGIAAGTGQGAAPISTFVSNTVPDAGYL